MYFCDRMLLGLRLYGINPNIVGNRHRRALTQITLKCWGWYDIWNCGLPDFAQWQWKTATYIII